MMKNRVVSKHFKLNIINIVLTLLIFIDMSYSANITECNNCIEIINNIQNSSSVTKYLHDLYELCNLFNNTKCETYLTKIEHNIKHLNASNICYEMKYCDRLNFGNRLFSSDDFRVNLTLPKQCDQSNQIQVDYIKYYNKLIALYDKNSYDEFNCYKYHSNNGIFDPQPWWEMEFDSEILYYRSTGLEQVGGCEAQIFSIPQLYIIGTKYYRYYILNNGTIFRKFKMDGIEVFHDDPQNYGPFSYWKNGTITTKNSIYSEKYVAKLENVNKGPICKITDIQMKKLFSFY